MRQEKPNAAVLRQKLIEVRIIRRANEAIDLGHGSFERVVSRKWWKFEGGVISG